MKRQYQRRRLTKADGEYILWHVFLFLFDEENFSAAEIVENLLNKYFTKG
jgi:hypothetical protein